MMELMSGLTLNTVLWIIGIWCLVILLIVIFLWFWSNSGR